MSDKKKQRTAVRDTLIALQGKTVTSMSAKEKDRLLGALAQLLGVMDETGKVKAVA